MAANESPKKASEVEASVLPLAEEWAQVGVEAKVTGRVLVRTATDEVEKLVRQDLQTTDAEVVRVPVGRVLDAGEEPQGPRIEGPVTVVPVFQEVLLVEKRLMLKEEVHIKLQSRLESVEYPVTLKTQSAIVERLGPEDRNDTT